VRRDDGEEIQHPQLTTATIADWVMWRETASLLEIVTWRTSKEVNRGTGTRRLDKATIGEQKQREERAEAEVDGKILY
jgi:hypothetical protein